MKSKTSFFNRTVLKKDITRFFPLWGLYCVMLVLYYITEPAYYFGDMSGGLRTLQDIQFSMGTVNVLYAGMCAMLLFGDLYKSRLCNALHAMPVRREGWFFTHVTAALLFCIVPNTMLAIFIAPILRGYWYLSFLMLGISVLQFIGLFGIAVFAVMCAGNKLGMAVTYSILNCWSLLVEGFVSSFIHPLAYGLRLNEDLFYKLSPLNIMDVEIIHLNVSHSRGYHTVRTGFDGVDGKRVLTVAILGAFGLLLLGGALLLYRRRKLESAGDFIVIRPAAVIFHVSICILASILLISITDTYAIGLMGVVLGFFAGSMLLQRKVNVFNRKSIQHCGIMLAALALILLAARLDPLGLTKKVPKVEEVKSVRIYHEYGGTILQADTPEDIELVTQMQEKLIEKRLDRSAYNHIVFEYALRDGSSFKRYYPVNEYDLDLSALTSYYRTWQRIFDTEDWDGFLKSVAGISVTDYATGEELLSIGESWWDRYVSIDVPEQTDADIIIEMPREEKSDTAIAMEGETRLQVLELLEAMKNECGHIRPAHILTQYFGEEYVYIVEITQDRGCITLMLSKDCTESAALIEALLAQYV